MTRTERSGSTWTSASTRIALAALLGVAAAAPAPAQAADDPAFGLWLVESGRAIVDIAACGDKACGTVVWLAEPNGADGAPRLDVENEDEALRSRPLCGLPVVGDFARVDEGEWDDGFIYDAAEGDLYDAKMEVQDDGTLKVRGFLGISLLGRSQVWTRAEDARGGC